jgi:hypothetical protein
MQDAACRVREYRIVDAGRSKGCGARVIINPNSQWCTGFNQDSRARDELELDGVVPVRERR